MANTAYQTDDDLRDYPRQMRLAMVADKLAEVLYYMRAEGYGLACLKWSEVSPQAKHHYRGYAVDYLRDVKPAKDNRLLGLAVDLALDRAKLVGAITPAEPYGVELDSRD